MQPNFRSAEASSGVAAVANGSVPVSSVLNSGSDRAFELFRTAVSRLGYDRIAFVPVTPAARQALGVIEVAPTQAANVPEDWVRHYAAKDYLACDPIVLQAPSASSPLVWADMLASGSLSAKQRRVLLEGREAGLLDGVSIPLHGPRGEAYVVSLAAERDGIAQAAEHATLHLLAVQFLLSYSRARRVNAAQAVPIHITDRERECLTWTARGKSAWTIGKILDVSEHTVNFHLKRGMAKLGATNRMQAVVSALRLGLILP
jgi:LuxR family quorum-sensing system transcriptional regulator CciR